MAVRLKNLTIRGFKTIRHLENFQPGPLNVLIGANGAGKSNFLSFFRLLSQMLTPPGDLQLHVGSLGRASAFLHDGPGVTQELAAGLSLEGDEGSYEYAFQLAYAAGDTFVFADERYRVSGGAGQDVEEWRPLGAGHSEAKIVAEAEAGETAARALVSSLRHCLVYQFHNTSFRARLRGAWNVNDGHRLKDDAGNLAPFLLRLRDQEPKHYRKIVKTVGLLAPFFADFELEPMNGKLLLQWREHGSDVIFDASHASDGMLRMMALIALLGQPAQDLPPVLLVDEPELGLHPYAMDTVVGMLKTAAAQVQVVVATQSAPFLDWFDPPDIVVVDRRGRESTFTRHSAKDLADWLEEYSLSDLWEKNVLGGRP